MSTKKQKAFATPIAILTINVREASEHPNVAVLDSLARWGRRVTRQVARHPEKYANKFRAKLYV